MKSWGLVIGLSWASILFGEQWTRPPGRPRLADTDRHSLIDSARERKKSTAAFPIWTIPSVVSSPGRFGAFFKTKVIVFNPTSFDYEVVAIFFDQDGEQDSSSFHLSANSFLLWNDFLQEAFGIQGAGAVQFDSWLQPPGGSEQFDFFVTSEVYTDSPTGRYKTVVIAGHQPESISGNSRATNVGINVTSSERTNIGVFNDSSFSTTVTARVLSFTGELVETITFSLPTQGWSQKPVTAQVSNGTIEWETNGPVYPYSVTVDNRSNDGSFASPNIYTP
jgi:hypothetical protein